MNADGFVYWVRSGDRIKIGYSTKPYRRISALQTAHGDPLELLALVPGTKQDELDFHIRFVQQHTLGEWFRCDESLLALASRLGVCGGADDGGDTMIGVRIPFALVARYHRLAREDHRKLTDVMRLLLSEWSEQMEAKKRVVA